MKTKLSLLFLLSFVFYLGTAQEPQGFNYQAIARDGSGNPLVSTSLPTRVTIQADSLGTSIIWQEVHSSVTSNSFGLINLVPGRGARQAMSTVANFSDIDWSVTPKFIKTEINYGGSYKTMGISRLWSVPYALIAGDLAGSVDKLAVQGKTSGLEEALFEVKNKDGQTVFAVYNEGVRIYVDDGAKGTKGGFAVGGFGTDKADSQKYLFVTDTSTRIYVKQPAKGVKGGFAVGGFDNTKTYIGNYLDLTPENYFIGHLSGLQNKSGRYNSFFGYETGKSNTDGDQGIFLGYKAGYMNTIGDYNTFIGSYAGYNNIRGYRNVFIGDSAGASNTTGYMNVFEGHQSGKSNTEGSLNTFIGEETGTQNTTGYRNIFVGTQAGFNNISGRLNLFIGVIAGAYNTIGERNIYIGQASGYLSDSANFNVFIGDRSGMYNTKGANNVMIGSWVGQNTTKGSYNVFIGDRAGYHNQSGDLNTYLGSRAGENASGSNNVFLGSSAGTNESGSNRLYIANTSTSTPLIYGIFDDIPANQILTINGSLGIGTSSPAYILQVGNAGDGTQARANAWNLLSDVRLKSLLTTPDNSLEMINKMNGYYFYWNTGSDKTRQFGFSAQEVVKVLPEIVSRGEDGMLSLDYGKVTPLLVEAIKEQQQQIESYKSENDNLKSLLQSLQEKVDKIEVLLAKSFVE